MIAGVVVRVGVVVAALTLGACSETQKARDPNGPECSAFVRHGLELGLKQAALKRGHPYDPAKIEATLASTDEEIRAGIDKQRKLCALFPEKGLACAMRAASVEEVQRCDDAR